MYLNNFFLEYEDIVKSFPEQCHQDYLNIKGIMDNSTVKYNGEPIPFLYQPMFFTPEDIRAFKDLTNTVMSILNKVIKQYLVSTEFRKKFGFSKLLEELILVDPGYQIAVPMARLDLFYYEPRVFKFCEINADGSSGMNKSNVLERLFLHALPVSQMKLKYDIQYFELVETWTDESLQLFHQFNPDIKNPNVAIVDWQGAGNLKEFEVFQAAYVKKGCKTQIVDPRQLKYDGKALYFQDMKVDLIYRRLVTSELIDRHSEMMDLILAYQNRAVCMVGPIRSEISHNKIIFKVLHQDTTNILSEAEREFIKRHIPYTAEFKGNQNIFSLVLKNKDQYVLKPTNMYAAAGVYLGRDFTESQWQQKVKQCWENNYLYQEYCQPFYGQMVELQGDHGVTTNHFNQMIGLFAYNEKLSGLYTRVGKSNVISQQHGYYILPNYYIVK